MKATEMAGFEAAMGELEGILAKMMEDGTPLRESVALYARAAELMSRCTEGLDEARVQVEEIDLRMKGREAEHDL